MLSSPANAAAAAVVMKRGMKKRDREGKKEVLTGGCPTAEGSERDLSVCLCFPGYYFLPFVRLQAARDRGKKSSATRAAAVQETERTNEYAVAVYWCLVGVVLSILLSKAREMG